MNKLIEMMQGLIDTMKSVFGNLKTNKQISEPTKTKPTQKVEDIKIIPEVIEKEKEEIFTDHIIKSSFK